MARRIFHFVIIVLLFLVVKVDAEVSLSTQFRVDDATWICLDIAKGEGLESFENEAELQWKKECIDYQFAYLIVKDAFEWVEGEGQQIIKTCSEYAGNNDEVFDLCVLPLINQKVEEIARPCYEFSGDGCRSLVGEYLMQSLIQVIRSNRTIKDRILSVRFFGMPIIPIAALIALALFLIYVVDVILGGKGGWTQTFFALIVFLLVLALFHLGVFDKMVWFLGVVVAIAFFVWLYKKL